MKGLIFVLDFVMLILLGFIVGVEYSTGAGLAVFFALTYLHEIKEAVQNGATK